MHDVHRMIRATLDHYPERVAIGAVGVRSAARFARYVRQDELHLAVDTQLAASRFDADEVRAAIEDCLESVGSVGAAASWLLSDHDLSRPASRYGAGPVGPARARAMALVQLALPGAAYVYNGDELGLPDADLPDEARRDAVWHHGEDSRDGCRVPQPWEDDLPAYGFTTGEPWLPIPDEYAALNAAAQLEDTGSTLSLYRRALELRRLHPGIRGTPAAPAPRSSGSAPRPAAWRSGARARPWCARSTPRPPRSRCPPATRCWSAGPWTTACCPRTPRSGSPDLRVLMPSTRPAAAPGGRTPRPPASCGWW